MKEKDNRRSVIKKINVESLGIALMPASFLSAKMRVDNSNTEADAYASKRTFNAIFCFYH
jgi:hypothetical protein